MHSGLNKPHVWIRIFNLYVIASLYGCVLVSGWTEWEKVVNAARCRVRCLANLRGVEEIHMPRSEPKQGSSLSQCLADSPCVECLKPCTQPYVSLPMCQRICEESNLPQCMASCNFLRDVYVTHTGTCPPETEVILSQFGCGSECVGDNECALEFKCCATTCGTTCHPPLEPYQGMPMVPQQPTIREKLRGGSIDIRWDMGSESESRPILYIVEARYNVGQQHSLEAVTDWQQIAQTTGKSISIREITPGHWYQFRLSAVNDHGSRGASQPTEPYRLSREPDAPGAPRNLTEGDTIIKDERIGVIIKWLAPKRSDLPVARYRVLWSKRTVDPQVMTDGEQRENVDGDNLQFLIPHLQPDTTYLVQVQAISQYGDTKLKSDRDEIYITTYNLPNSIRGHNDELDIQTLATPKPVEELNVHTPFYQNGLLKANLTWIIPTEPEVDMVESVPEVSEMTPPPPHIERVMVNWKPDVCITDAIQTGISQTLTATTEESVFVLFDLRFDCHYEVNVQSLSQNGVNGPAVTLNFPTPSCHNVVVRGDMRPDCPTNAPRIPEPPIRLQSTFIISRGNITARLTWQQPPSDTPITGYRVQWGEMLLDFGLYDGDPEADVSPILDKSTTFYKVLSVDETEYSITSLKEATRYMAKVQAISRGGEGRVAFVTFNTPLISLKPIHPSYSQVTERDSIYDYYESSTYKQRQYPPTPAPMEESNQIMYSSASSIVHSYMTSSVTMVAILCLIVTSRTLNNELISVIER